MKRLALLVSAIIAVACFASDEIKVTCELTAVKDVLSVEYKPGRIQVDMTGDAISDIVQTFTDGTTNAITIAAGVATNGYTFFHNVTTNTAFTIAIGNVESNTFWPILKLKAEEVGLVRLYPTGTFYGKADGGTVNLRTLVIED